ncbi:unannotated protein [freshwater metagenome]|uniref:Unannotated protein n=1 Tax=freshwater metagenome TaxID=449393 RepID=A0A6J6SKA0_9ZZZZ
MVIVTGGKTCNDRLAVAALLPVSAARTVMFAVVAEAAVPLITPVAGLSVKPDGRVPLVIDQVNPPRPLAATSAVLYATPETALGSVDVVTLTAPLMTIVRDCRTNWLPLSVTRTVKLELPVAVGVPEITPAALRFRPAGRVPLCRLQTLLPAPPVATKVWL